MLEEQEKEGFKRMICMVACRMPIVGNGVHLSLQKGEGLFLAGGLEADGCTLRGAINFRRWGGHCREVDQNGMTFNKGDGSAEELREEMLWKGSLACRVRLSKGPTGERGGEICAQPEVRGADHIGTRIGNFPARNNSTRYHEKGTVAEEFGGGLFSVKRRGIRNVSFWAWEWPQL